MKEFQDLIDRKFETVHDKLAREKAEYDVKAEKWTAIIANGRYCYYSHSTCLVGRL